MPSISWDDRLNLGIPEIDQQHQRLVQMIDDLSEAMIQGRSQEVLQSILAGLVDYTHIHFATEERYFAQVQYPETPRHQAQHQTFIDRITEFRSACPLTSWPS
jgi:hemerythrin